MHKPITPLQQAFLDAYRVAGMVKEAAARVGCSRELHYGAMRTSGTYRAAFAIVQRDVAYELEEEARRRAISGVKVPVLFRGKVVGYETRYSDLLLVFLLEANNPEKFAGIRQELGRRDSGFCVRWDRDEVSRPKLPRMIGPQPPKPPRPPRPPRLPLGEWMCDLEGLEAAERESRTGEAAGREPDPELIRLWASMDLGPEESGLRNAAPQPEGDDADPESAIETPWEPSPATEEEPARDEEREGGRDSDVGFCVRWGRSERNDPDGESALQASEPERRPPDRFARAGRVDARPHAMSSPLDAADMASCALQHPFSLPRGGVPPSAFPDGRALHPERPGSAGEHRRIVPQRARPAPQIVGLYRLCRQIHRE